MLEIEIAIKVELVTVHVSIGENTLQVLGQYLQWVFPLSLAREIFERGGTGRGQRRDAWLIKYHQ